MAYRGNDQEESRQTMRTLLAELAEYNHLFGPRKITYERSAGGDEHVGISQANMELSIVRIHSSASTDLLHNGRALETFTKPELAVDAAFHLLNAANVLSHYGFRLSA